jgi:hypothetical protein
MSTQRPSSITRYARRLGAIVAAVAAVSLTNVAPAAAATVPAISCVSGWADFRGVDNSGFDRSFSMTTTIWKHCGVSARTEYKMNFGPYVNTSWKTGLRKYTNGQETGVVTDNFYYSNAARGAWVKVCSTTGCGSSTYVDNPYN